MEDIDIVHDISKYSKEFSKIINIGDKKLRLDIIGFNDSILLDILAKWQMCLSFLGKSHLFYNKKIIRTLYCLLTDSYIVKEINHHRIDIDFFDISLKKFLRLEIVDNNNRKIKIRLFNICNEMIVFDFKDRHNYKIYHLFNLDKIKECYSNVVDFDVLSNDFKSMLIFQGDIESLPKDYKILANFDIKKKINLEWIIKLSKFNKDIESKIQREYSKIKLRPVQY